MAAQAPAPPTTDDAPDPHDITTWSDLTDEQVAIAAEITEAHLDGIVQAHLCGKGAILGISPDTNEAVLIPMLCGRWSCERCARRKIAKWTARIAQSQPDRFITLTDRPRPELSPTQHLQLLKRKLARLVPQIRKRWGPFEYAVAWEFTKLGTPHAHIVARSDYIPQRWLSQQWLHLTGAFRVHIRKVKSTQRIASYITKYVLKHVAATAEHAPGLRLITCSRHFLLHPKGEDTPARFHDFKWAYLPISVFEAASILQTVYRMMTLDDPGPHATVWARRGFNGTQAQPMPDNWPTTLPRAP